MNKQRVGYSSLRRVIFCCWFDLDSSFFSTVHRSISYLFFACSNLSTSSASIRYFITLNQITKPSRPSALTMQALVECDKVYIRGITWCLQPVKPRMIPIGSLAYRPKISPCFNTSLIETLIWNYSDSSSCFFRAISEFSPPLLAPIT